MIQEEEEERTPRNSKIQNQIQDIRQQLQQKQKMRYGFHFFFFSPPPPDYVFLLNGDENGRGTSFSERITTERARLFISQHFYPLPDVKDDSPGGKSLKVSSPRGPS